MAAKNRHNHIDCLAAALPDEEYFVFLARDPAFCGIIAIWASLRVGNYSAALDNFRLLMSDGLLQHYQQHPDEAKSVEAMAVIQRGYDWRERNLTAGPNGTPSWKQSLVRPKMIQIEPELVENVTQALMRKIAAGLRKINDALNNGALIDPWDKVDGKPIENWLDEFASELEAAADNPPMLVRPKMIDLYATAMKPSGKPRLDACPGKPREIGKHPALGAPYGGDGPAQEICPDCHEFTCECDFADSEPITEIDGNTGRPVGDHGTGEQAIRYALEDGGLIGEETTAFLSCWQEGALDEYPDFYEWLARQEGESNG